MYTDDELLHLWRSGANLSAEVYRRHWMMLLGLDFAEISRRMKDDPPTDSGMEFKQWMAVRQSSRTSDG